MMQHRNELIGTGVHRCSDPMMTVEHSSIRVHEIHGLLYSILTNAGIQPNVLRLLELLVPDPSVGLRSVPTTHSIPWCEVSMNLPGAHEHPELLWLIELVRQHDHAGILDAPEGPPVE